MLKMMTIGKLADAADVKVSTLRYYEREGLLKPTARSPRGYRQYHRPALERLRFIRAAQAAGFSLNNVKSLLRLSDYDRPPCDTVRDLIDARLNQVERQLADLGDVRRMLRDAHQRCEIGEARGICAVLDRFTTVAVGPSGRSS